MKKIIVLLLIASLMCSMAGCGKAEPAALEIEPEISQMTAICELAVMECYYHNVAKFEDGEDQKGFLGFGNKYKHFWIEYSGIVTLGIDASLVEIEINDTEITITLPEAKVLSCKETSETMEFIVDKESTKITGEDEIAAMEKAREHMKESAASDTALLENAKQRAMQLLENYVNSIGSAVGKQYTIHWKFIDNSGNPL